MTVDTMIDILIPVWNAARTLEVALRSIARQTEPRFRCLILDDGSSDGSLRVARAFAERDPRFHVLALPHRGLVPALNAGIDRVRAPFVARMDADDWMHRDRLTEQLATLQANRRLEAVGSLVRLFPRRGRATGRRAYEAWLNSLRDPQSIYLNRFVECPIAHPSLMIRRDRLCALRYRDEGWPEDYDLVLRLLERGPCIGTTTRRLLGWRDADDRLSRSDPRYGLDRFTACRADFLSRGFLGDRAFVLWGHGRTGRALRRALAEKGHRLKLIVDVHPRRIGQSIHGVPVVTPDALSTRSPDPIVVSVAGAGPRGEIRAALDRMGYVEGIDYVCAA